MRFFRSRFLLSFLVLSLAGCSGFVFFSGSRVVIAVTVSPNIADPANFPGQQVQFLASGTFTMSPTVVSPLPGVIWTVDRPAFSGQPDLGHASIDQNGVARCTPGFSGVVQVIATAPFNPTFAVSPSNQRAGVAQMNCP